MSVRRPAESLLDEIADSALDDDYYLVRAGESREDRSPNTVLVGLVMVLFATLVTVAALQTAVDRPGRVVERGALINDIDAGNEQLAQGQQALEGLQEEVRALGAGEMPDVRRLASLGVLSAESAVRGPGVEIRLEDAVAGPTGLVPEGGVVTAADLRIVVNALWYAGAEAVAIDDRRLSTLSAITTVDGVVQVAYRPVATPITVRALGDAGSLKDRFEGGAAGRYLLEREETDGLDVDVTSSDDVELPAAARGVDSVDHARALQEDR